MLLLVAIFFLVDKFILPLFTERDKIKVEKPLEEIKMEPPLTPLVLEEEEVALYFTDDNAQYLIPEYRKIKKPMR